MNVEIGTEYLQFPEEEYVNGVCVAVYLTWGRQKDKGFRPKLALSGSVQHVSADWSWKIVLKKVQGWIMYLCESGDMIYCVYITV